MVQPWPRYHWPEGRDSAFCFTVDVDADSPYLWSQRAPEATRSLGQLEQRRFGPRLGIWRLLDLLDRFGVKGSFFVPGAVAEANPELLPAFLEQGHEIGLHGYFHEIVAQSSDAEFTGALEASIEVFRRQTGAVPKGFRSPAWEMTPHMLAEIRRHGFYDSSLMGADHPYEIDGVVEVPVQWAIDDAVFFKFTGGGTDQWPPAAPGPILEGWLDEWDGLHRLGGLFMLTVHDWISGRAQRLRLLERLLERITAEPTVWVATVGQVAAHHVRSTNAGRFQAASDIPGPVEPRRFGRPK
ncbi:MULTISPECIES: polysaccharide deacetylase family protein [unclassified Inquilinus]|uniref:polysaccharide deacetylase family protein n=1 Tax=unclassified Inquilinus TaxID=2645927 RepID=UPI003F8F162E